MDICGVILKFEYAMMMPKTNKWGSIFSIQLVMLKRINTLSIMHIKTWHKNRILFNTQQVSSCIILNNTYHHIIVITLLFIIVIITALVIYFYVATLPIPDKRRLCDREWNRGQCALGSISGGALQCWSAESIDLTLWISPVGVSSLKSSPNWYKFKS